jgi:hypothetical protein
MAGIEIIRRGAINLKKPLLTIPWKIKDNAIKKIELLRPLAVSELNM